LYWLAKRKNAKNPNVPIGKVENAVVDESENNFG
tara:strand:+ start:26 stop:127 length:102 start_codon:yes stop_codon:yes gene_type:complete